MEQRYGGTNPFRSAGGRGPEGQPEQGQPEHFGSNGRRVRGKFPVHIVIIAAVIFCLLILAGNSYYMLDEDNYAVVTTLGRAETVSQAGLHFKFPFLQHVRRVSKVIMGMPIGYDIETGESIDEESVMITKDFNFVNTDFYLEYKISDPVKYLYASEDPEGMLKMLAQSYIRDTVGTYNVDDVITTGKSEIQSVIQEKLSERMIQEDIGLAVEKITIQDAFPPTTEVLNAFKNVENAKQGKDTAINNANKQRNEQIPLAEAECDQIIKDAEAQKEARINEAEGQVSRFEQMYEEYTKYPLITKQRMFYETMEEVLPSLRIYIVDESGTQKLLPLDDFGGAQIAGASAGGQSGSGTAFAGQTGSGTASAAQAGGAAGTADDGSEDGEEDAQ